MWNDEEAPNYYSDTESFWKIPMIGSYLISFDSLTEKWFMCIHTAHYCQRRALGRGKGEGG